MKTMLTPTQQSALLALVESELPTIRDAYLSRDELAMSYKSDGCDFATETDVKVETSLTEGILEIFPDAIIYGEESGLHETITDDRLVFFLDPIDGTKFFRYGITLFTLSVGIQLGGKNIYGIIADPMTGEIYHGGLEYGAYNQSGKIAPPPVALLSKTQIYYDTVGLHEASPDDQQKGLEFIKNLHLHAYRARTAGASCAFSFGAFSGLIGAMVDIFGGVKPTDRVAYSAVLQALGWEEREVHIGNAKNLWLAPSEMLDALHELLPS